VRLRPGQTIDELRDAVDELRIQVANLSAWSTTHESLRQAYLNWVRDAEGIGRRLLLDVPANQFATTRWSAIVADDVPPASLWSVAADDTAAQLDWFDTVLLDLQPVDPLGRDSEGSDFWTPGTIRLFISHLAAHKSLATEISVGLRALGVQGFVAHEAIEPSREWQAEIENALRSALAQAY
jgi:hypothetical protein